MSDSEASFGVAQDRGYKGKDENVENRTWATEVESKGYSGEGSDTYFFGEGHCYSFEGSDIGFGRGCYFKGFDNAKKMGLRGVIFFCVIDAGKNDQDRGKSPSYGKNYGKDRGSNGDRQKA